MVIYLDQYRKTGKALAAARHEREKLCVKRATGVTAVACARDTAMLRLPPLPGDFAGADPDAFLDRVYALATQI